MLGDEVIQAEPESEAEAEAESKVCAVRLSLFYRLRLTSYMVGGCTTPPKWELSAAKPPKVLAKLLVLNRTIAA